MTTGLYQPSTAKPDAPKGLQIDRTRELSLLESLLVREDPEKKTGKAYDLNKSNPNYNRITQAMHQNIVDNRLIMSVLPDIRIALSMQASLVLAPSDMLGCDFTIETRNLDKELQVEGNWLAIVDTFIRDDYNLRRRLHSWLNNTMGEYGSQVIAVLPHSAIDNIINSDNKLIAGNESFKDLSSKYETSELPLMGFVGSTALVAGTENYANKPNSIELISWASDNIVTLTDNYETLKYPNLLDYRRANIRRTKLLSNMFLATGKLVAGLEDNNEPIKPHWRPSESNNTAIDYGSVFKARVYNKKNSIEVNIGKTDESIFDPTIIELNSAACIPIVSVNDKRKVKGVVVLLNGEGRVISNDEIIQNRGFTMTNLSDGSISSTAMTNIRDIVSKSGMAEKDSDSKLAKDTRVMSTTDSVNLLMYVKRTLEKNIYDAIKDGVNGDSISDIDVGEVLSVMMERALHGKRTRVLYLPEELVSYMVVDIDEDGVGISRISHIKTQASMLANLKVGEVIAELRAAIPRRKIDMTIDDRDTDPISTAETLLHNLTEVASNALDFRHVNPADISQSLTRASYEVNIHHKSLPQTKLELTDKNSSPPSKGTGLYDNLRRECIMGIGMQPEVVDAYFKQEFATEIENRGNLQTKAVIDIQDVWEPGVSDHLQRILRFTPRIRNAISASINVKAKPSDMNDDEVVDALIDSIWFSLPRPEVNGLKALMESITQYTSYLDVVITAWLDAASPGRLTRNELADVIDPLKADIKGLLLRDFIEKNNGFEPMGKFLAKNEEGVLQLKLDEVIEDNTKAMMDMFESYIAIIKKAEKKLDDKIDKIENPPEPPAPTDPVATDPTTDPSTEPTGLEDIVVEDEDAPATDPAASDETAIDKIDLGSLGDLGI